MKIIHVANDDRLSGTEYVSLDLIADPFIILRADGTILDANMRFFTLVGLSREEALGRGLRDIIILHQIESRILESLSLGTEMSLRISFYSRHFDVLLLPFMPEQESWLVRIVFKDVTSFLNLEKELIRRNKELIIVNTLSGAFISAENVDLVLEDLMEKVMIITDFPMGWLLIRDAQNFRLRTYRGISPELQQRIAAGCLDHFCTDALAAEGPLYIPESSHIADAPDLRDADIAFLAFIPLVSSYHVTGLLCLAGGTGKELSADFAALLSLVGNHMSHIMDKVRLFQETRRLAITDSLTGLYNSRYFYRQLDIEVARAKRYGNSFSLMIFDIDNFKVLNDTCGHQEGDEVLQGLARAITSVCRETDVVARYGGEEFIIILPNTARDEATALAKRILLAVQETSIALSAELSITLSGGIATFPQNASSARTLLSAADNALYAAKAAGKNTVVCFQEMMHE